MRRRWNPSAAHAMLQHRHRVPTIIAKVPRHPSETPWMSIEAAPTSPPGSATSTSARMDLFLISVLILFFELACIRWFPAHVLYLTFFTNTVLLACFLGMSLGCLAANHPRNYL